MVINEDQSSFQLRQDGLNFISEQKKIFKNIYLQNYGFELSVSKFSPKENFVAVGLMDGSLGIINMRNTMRSFTHPIWNKVPLTALEWLDNSSIYIANTDGVLTKVSIFDDSKRKIEVCDSVWQDKEDQILTMAINKEVGQIIIAGKRANINLLDLQTN